MKDRRVEIERQAALARTSGGYADLKAYRAPRSLWMALFGVAVSVAVLTIVGPIDYAAQLDLESANKELRVELARLKAPEVRVAPIRPWRRCGEKPFIARQADGGRWRIKCAPGADLTRRQ